MQKMNKEKALELKTQGNDCIKEGKFAEAMLHYTEAIKYDNSSPQLYSNRSLVFLKMQHHYFAYQDAKDAIRLDPLWHKAYYRKAEVEFATQNYTEALKSYHQATQIQADPAILDCIIRTSKELQRQQKMDLQIPWVSAGIGLILGVLLVVLDATIPKTSIFEHPVIQVLVAIALSVCGLGIGRCYQWYSISQRKSLLEPPPDLLPEHKDESVETEQVEAEAQEEKKPHPRYTKAQARQRYKKGKS